MPLLTVQQVAIVANVSAQLVYSWCNSGQLAHLRLGTPGKRGTIRIEEADLLDYLASCRQAKPATPPAEMPGTPPGFDAYMDDVSRRAHAKAAREETRRTGETTGASRRGHRGRGSRPSRSS